MRNEDIKRQLGVTGGDFYITAPAPCPYLSGRLERKVFSYLSGPRASEINSILSQRGFRRSQNIIYLPACDSCSACAPVRVVAPEFRPSKSRKRILKKNGDILRRIRPAVATQRQFSVLRDYLDSRHADGGMADMTALDYASMVEETAVDTMVIEYTLETDDGGERLIACALSDRVVDGFSMVYSFFDPAEADRSLGAYMILDHINMALERGLSHVYLGYWVPGSPKMDYKKNFSPLERLTPEGWRALPKD
ncbi:MAG: arginyltransferase [Pseudomonadota bacterium]